LKLCQALRAYPKGKKVTVRAELLEVDGRKLRFKVKRMMKTKGW
jgi:predicted thioesterase